MTAYELVKTIKDHTGWSLDKLSEESLVTFEALKKIHRTPEYRGNRTTRRLLGRCYLRVVGSKFPSDIDALHEHLDELVGELRDHASLLQFQLEHIFRPALMAHPEWNKANLADCRLQWVMGHSYLETLRLSGNQDLKAFVNAEAAYKLAAEIMRNQGGDDAERVAFKIELNILAMVFNQCDRGSRATSPEVRQWLRSLNVIAKVQAAVEAEPWHLELLRLGLLAAAVLEDDIACIDFILKIKELSKTFFDDGVAPVYGLPAASDDPDLCFIYRNQLHLAVAEDDGNHVKKSPLKENDDE